jgi:FkbH-like protein
MGISLQVELSPYVDGLDLEMALRSESDATIIWLDASRIRQSERESLQDLAQEIALGSSGTTFLVVEDLDDSGQVSRDASRTRLSTISMPRLILESEDSAVQEMSKYGHRFNSPRYRPFVAELVLKHLSTTVSEPIRMLAVDFDNTLYSGVVGEDGISGIRFLDTHRELWDKLVELKVAGVLLVGITKNDPRDIEKLFNQNSGFGLSRDVFTSIYAGWKSKADFLDEALESTNLDQTQCAFLDDNPAELHEINSTFSHVYCIDSKDPIRALNILRFGPRIPLGRDVLADLRSQDIGLRQKRLSVKSIESPSSVHRALQSRVVVGFASEAELTRCQELVNKTNQFNISLRRTDLDRVYAEGPLITLWASVSDKFGDSGIVATIVASCSKEGDLVIQEFCISCRVLGRELENVIFAAGIEFITTSRPSNNVYMKWGIGARNEPALGWASIFDRKRLPDGTEVMIIREEWVRKTVDSEDFRWIFRKTSD